MAEVKTLRERFAARDADVLIGKLACDYKRRPPSRGWTTKAVWYEDDDGVFAVVGDQEGADVDVVLAHGLYHACGKQLKLLLPNRWADPTLHRIPWLAADVEIFTYSETGRIQDGAKPTKEEARQRAGDADRTRAVHLGDNVESVRPLLEWATKHDDLDAAHNRSVRAWSCNGQRVLTITGKRKLKVSAGIDATGDPAYRTVLDSRLTDLDLTRIQRQVEAGIRHAKSKKYGKFEEHHLQVILRRDPSLLLLEHPLLREVPAWRPVGGERRLGRGYIDLVGLDPAGDITIVETKLDSDDMLILQGLDYWIWATAESNHEWLADRLYSDPKAHTRLLYAVGGKNGGQPKIGRYERTHLDLLDPEIPWRMALIEGWNDAVEGPRVDVLADRSVPPS